MRGFTLIELLVVVFIMALLLAFLVPSLHPKKPPSSTDDAFIFLISSLASKARQGHETELLIYGKECNKASFSIDGKSATPSSFRFPKGLQHLSIDTFGNLIPNPHPPLVQDNTTLPVCFRYRIDKWGFGTFALYRLNHTYYFLDPFTLQATRFKDERALLDTLFKKDLLPLDGAYLHE
jgi:prepilin-type N-terminal cleavage/methylation domain-containing protein